MDGLTREQVMDALEQGWGTYVARFRQLTPEAQARSLARQGYARLADVLAHVLAWWNEALPAVEALQTDPGFASPDYDVDAFNAQAVQRCAALSEAAVGRSLKRGARPGWRWCAACPTLPLPRGAWPPGCTWS
jgi:hypothetical protein